MNIWLFGRSIFCVLCGLGLIGSYFWYYQDYSYLPPDRAYQYQEHWRLYWGLVLVCVGIGAIAFRYWLIRSGHEPWFFKSKKQTPEKP
jgi:hypothetical protein